MPRGYPVDPETRAAILKDIKAENPRNAIARAHNVSPGTVTNIANEAGVTDAFDRAATKKATEAHVADARAERAELAADALDTAREMMRRGRDPKNGHDAQGWATAFGIYADKHLVLERADATDGSDEAASMLGKLASDLKQAWEGSGAGQSPDEPQAGGSGRDQ